MPRRKEKIETIITWEQEEITLNKTIPLGETKIKATKTPMGTIKTNSKGITTTISGQTYLVLFAVSMDIILTIIPRFSTSNG
jgi:hypothetical protein